MKHFIVVLILIGLVGCATVLIVEERDIKGNLVRSIRAEDYSIKTPTLTAVPSRWLTPNFVSEIFRGVIGWQSIIPAVPPTPSPGPIPPPLPVPTPTPTPYPAPGPTPIPNPVPGPVAESTVFSRNGNVITLDLNTLPGSMRAAGWQGRDNALYYAMGSIYLHGPGPELPTGGDGDLTFLSDNRAGIYKWFDAEVAKVKSTMMTYPAYTVVAVTNDGRDRLGSRLGPAIADRLKEFGGRVTTGYMMPESEY